MPVTRHPPPRAGRAALPQTARTFFGGELGLALQGRTPDRLQFVGAGGHVSLSVRAGDPVIVELETREWDIQVEAFMERIARKRWGVS
jgi:hypothetical protein